MSAVLAPDERRNLRRVILASSAGTLIEWYDFYLFGALATILAANFFPKGNETAAFLSVLATFGAGFVVRPFGALVFGRMGDLVGRKVTFLLTLVMMGASTCVIGLLPTYETLGVAAPVVLVLLRLLQGLALGGEYGGAATYVAEHSPVGQRGHFTSYIQTTATLGLFVSLAVILITRVSLGEAAFGQWGWRIPFLLSAVLVFVSYLIRRRMEESPLFADIKAAGTTSKNPLRESFVQPENRRLVLLALFGATAGQGVVWYTGQFYAMTFLEKVMMIRPMTVNMIVAVALLLATPLFVVFGRLSDRVGRLKIMMFGCALAALLYIPIYQAMLLQVAPAKIEVGVAGTEFKVDRAVDPVTKQVIGVEQKTERWSNGFVRTTKTPVTPDEPHRALPKEKAKVEIQPPLAVCITLGALIFIQVVFVTMVYGPIAAFLVEMFPTRIRYTSMSLPYHVGNGVFGGLVPVIATYLQTSTKQNLAGLGYPIAIAVMTLLVGTCLIRHDSVHPGDPA